jgi:hypothetical protein
MNKSDLFVSPHQGAMVQEPYDGSFEENSNVHTLINMHAKHHKVLLLPMRL